MSSMLEEVGLTDRKRMRPVLEEQAVEEVCSALRAIRGAWRAAALVQGDDCTPCVLGGGVVQYV